MMKEKFWPPFLLRKFGTGERGSIVIKAGLIASFRQQRDLRREFIQAFIGQ
jgi:hypothetical protein